MSTDQDIENQIRAAGADSAPRITPADIEAAIGSEHYFTADDGVRATPEGVAMDEIPPPLELLTFCVLVLHNGFTVTGESACVSPENFDAEIGRKVARANAISKMWPLLGYELRNRIVRGEFDADTFDKYPAYRHRVIAEKAGLDEHLARLRVFCGAADGAFDSLPTEEKQRLTRQEGLMSELSAVLGERITAWRAALPAL